MGTFTICPSDSLISNTLLEFFPFESFSFTKQSRQTYQIQLEYLLDSIMFTSLRYTFSAYFKSDFSDVKSF